MRTSIVRNFDDTVPELQYTVSLVTDSDSWYGPFRMPRR